MEISSLSLTEPYILNGLLKVWSSTHSTPMDAEAGTFTWNHGGKVGQSFMGLYKGLYQAKLTHFKCYWEYKNYSFQIQNKINT